MLNTLIPPYSSVCCHKTFLLFVTRVTRVRMFETGILPMQRALKPDTPYEVRINRLPKASYMVTMGDIAERAGVSRPTVSVILNERHGEIGIAEDTRRKVLAAAEELGYRRNELARAVKTGKSLTIGFLAATTTLEYTSRFFSGAVDAAEDRNYSIQRFRIHEEDAKQDRKTIVRCVEHRLAGVVVYDPNLALPLGEMRREFEAHTLPTVLLDYKTPQTWGIGVASDDESGAEQAVQHLVEMGHRRILFCGGVENVGASVPRLAGYERAMRQCGLGDSVRAIWTNWHFYEQTPQLLSLMAEPAPPTAVFCASDALALNAMRVLRSLGHEVPRDVSVIGFGDLLRTDASDPALTTVHVPYEAIGQKAVQLLLESGASGNGHGKDRAGRDVLTSMIGSGSASNGSSKGSQHYVPTRLTLRDSTAPPRQSS